MAADGAQVPTSAISGHAGSVDAVADAVEQARSAVGQVAMDTQAYGILCQFLPALLEPVFDLAVEAMNGSVDALHDTAEGLRAVAAHTRATDAANAHRITDVELPL
jgi:hypothetical protein